MSNILLNWINNDIKLSKEIKDIPSEFRTGYLFAELLNKLEMIPVISLYKDSSNKKDILQNMNNLQKNLADINIDLDEKSKNKIMNCDIYTAKIYLYKIKQLVSNKNINLTQLNFKNSNILSQLYNSIYFKNENEKYLNKMHRENIYNSGIRNYKFMKKYGKNKYDKEGELYKMIKKEYSHLNLNEIDMEFILNDIKETEERMNYFKNYINTSEERQKSLNKLKFEKENNIWMNTMKTMDNLKQRITNRSLNKIINKQNLFNRYMKANSILLKKQSDNFDIKLSLYQSPHEHKKENPEEDQEEIQESLEEKMKREIKISQVMMANIRNKLEENIKNKKNKEKRERQKLREQNFNIKKYMPKKTLNLNIHINENNNIDDIKDSKTSTYSRLTKGDFNSNLIESSFKIHKGNIKIGNRIHFFKTVINSSDIKEIINKKNDDEKKENIFDELNKEKYEIFNENLTKKKIKKEKKIKEIKPLIEQMISMADYISEYEDKNNIDLIDNAIWKELSEKFKNNEEINQSEDGGDFIIKPQQQQYTNNSNNININNNQNEEEKQSLNSYSYNNLQSTNNSIDILSSFDDLYLDYINYTGLFNDIIIPHNLRIKKYKYPELYSEIYNYNIYNVDIKDYEPSEKEINNLFLPKYILNENIYFNDIITEILEYQDKDEGINNLKKELKKEEKITEYIFKKKGKYFYVPIKMAFTGYPCSGKKTQANLLKNIYPNIKIYDPEIILNEKINEYKELYEPNIEGNPKLKNMKPAQLEQHNKEIEEKKENFKDTLDIIKPYIDFIQNNDNNSHTSELKDKNNSNDKKDNIEDNNNNNSNEELNTKKEEILSSIYLKLIIDSLNKDFNQSPEEILSHLTENKSTFLSYSQTLEKITKNKIRLEDIEKELKDIQDQKEKALNKKELTTEQNNIIKEQDILIKELNSLKAKLYSGFIIINFPKTKKEIMDLENYFTGFELEYNKPENEVEKKLKTYDILDLNLEKKNLNKNFPLISFFDLFVNFEIDSKEVNERFNNNKYDPNTGKNYSLEEIGKINDKKLLEKLIQGFPNLNEKELEFQKYIYEKNIYDISDFYGRMSNGNNSLYINLNLKDNDGKKFLKEINDNLNNSIDDVVVKLFYENIEIIINEIKTQIHEEKINKEPIDNNINVNNNLNNNENEDNKIEEDKIEEEPQEINCLSSNRENNNNKEEEEKINNISDNTSTAYKEIISTLDTFYPSYKLSIKSFINLMSNQRKKLIKYLNQIQDSFIKYLNRPIEKNEIISMYIDKYNNLFKLNPKLKKNEKVFQELTENILDVKNSIWVKIQAKKNEDIEYLEEVRNKGEREKYINKFFNYALKIFEIELEKYLLKCEISIKYYLNKVGLLSNIMGIFHQNQDEFLFKIDYKKYLYYELVNNDDINKTKTELYNTLSTNETQNNYNSNNKKNKDNNNNLHESPFDKNIINNLNKIFVNSLKIIIRQEKLNDNYIDKIKAVINKGDKYNNKNSNSKDISLKYNKKGNISSISNANNNNNISVMTSKSTIFKNKVKILGNKLLNKKEELSLEEKLNLDLMNEKNNIKYRLMYLYSFISRYINILNECFDIVYNNMDEWIIINMKTQNNKLNEFITYLNRALNKNFEKISMEGREFNLNDKYIKNKKYILPIYKTLYPDEIININIKSEYGDDFKKNLVKLNSINLVQQYVYNIKDLFSLYEKIKEYGAQTCEYFVKYEIVKNIFINSVINSKEFFLFYEKDKKKFHDNKIFNGICKRMKFYSSEKIDTFIKIFFVYENKYININELFTTCLIIGSELISGDKFIEQVNQYISEDKKNKKNILLTKDEFIKINFWFEKDTYLNELSDYFEQNIFQGQYNNITSINQVNNQKYIMKENEEFNTNAMNEKRKNSDNRKPEKEKKINIIKEAIFEINKENNLCDINKIKNLLDKLNNYCQKKNEKKEANIDEKNKNQIDVDDNDKCFRYSSDDLDEYIYMDKHHKHNNNFETYIKSIFYNVFDK